MTQLGSSLAVLPSWSYGTPPCVRIDDGRMVHLLARFGARRAGRAPPGGKAARRSRSHGPAGARPLRERTPPASWTRSTLARDLAGGRSAPAGCARAPGTNMRCATCRRGQWHPAGWLRFQLQVVGETEAEQRALGAGPHSSTQPGDFAPGKMAWPGSAPGRRIRAFGRRPGSTSTEQSWHGFARCRAGPTAA